MTTQSDHPTQAAPVRGKFICLEGIEGVGKSTQVQALADHLSGCGIPVMTTREPGGTQISEAVRELLLSRDYPPMHEDTELLLVFAARAEHLQRRILPALEAGTWVISDRFTDATYAYQGGGRKIDVQRIAALENWVQGAFRPDLTLFLDASVATGLARAAKRGESDRFEQETLSFFERVRFIYHMRVQMNPGRYAVIDAEQSLEQVRADLIARVDALVNVGWKRGGA
ncbi:dTMP kinase [Ectothiorhodospira sp. BSL-9]|uniref:dTMP kinase n=1 Tax=Ectothiorhodospira sp. BSL-9 TaxID=1442136 RepID=UPI0007B44002|nr:dTMP kinase [Ectothiorhodospira sp. BSL-9]ANB03115.1 thymidylate kinase [Ectothiorhodospira sp. BSL-9]